MKNILITAGPIPGKLDSVKFITNRFKGGLMFKLADVMLKKFKHAVTIIKWKHTELPQTLLVSEDGYLPSISDNDGVTSYTWYKAGALSSSIIDYRLNVINVDDVYDYCKKVLGKEYDAYILGAAVANLVPSNPWEGKFPSHNYKVGDKFPIEFEIAPRVIDMIKTKYQKSLLVGYKLYDGEYDELISAGWHTLTNSKANIVFCNHPAWAKSRKTTLLPSGTVLELTYDEHVTMIDRMMNLKWYRTEINTEKVDIPEDIIKCVNNKLDWIVKNRSDEMQKFDEYDFGTVAMRYNGGFVTTTRGKKKGSFDRWTFVKSVDHNTRTVYADEKATLNAPLISKLFDNNPPDYDLVLHGHFNLDGEHTFDYLFPGTTEENKAAELMSFNVDGHGCYMVTKCETNNV